MNSLDEILGSIAVYLDSKVIKKEFIDKIDYKNVNKKRLEKHQTLLRSVYHVYKKVQRYPVYFEKFYVSEEIITEIEALEYHIHSYLEDLTILKNKIKVFFETLKNELRKTASNGKELSDDIKVFIRKIERVFKQVDTYRGPHHHRGLKFMDGKLLEAQNAQSTLEIIRSGVFLPRVANPEFIEKMKRKKKESFEEAKKNWTKLAKENNVGLNKFIDSVFLDTKSLIYQFFDIKPMSDIFGKNEK